MADRTALELGLIFAHKTGKMITARKKNKKEKRKANLLYVVGSSFESRRKSISERETLQNTDVSPIVANFSHHPRPS